VSPKSWPFILVFSQGLAYFYFFVSVFSGPLRDCGILLTFPLPDFEGFLPTSSIGIVYMPFPVGLDALEGWGLGKKLTI